MADNVTLPGTGAVIATDDVGSAQHQYVKLEFGADGTATKVSASDPLPVTVISGGDGSVQGVDASDAAITADPVFVGGRASAASPTPVSADGDAVGLWLTRAGALPTQVIEDAASAGAEPSMLVAAVRRDTASSGVGTDGDFANLAVDSSGRVWVNNSGVTQPVSGTVTANLAAGTNNIGDVDVLTLPALPTGTNNIGDVDVLTLPGAVGGVAHDAAASGSNPVLGGLEARTAVGTAVANGDLVRALGDVYGKQVVLVGALLEEQLRGLTNYTNNTGADVIAAQGSGIKIAVMGILVTNAHATVGTKVTIRDGTTARITGYAAAVGGGFSLSGNGVPIFITAANAAVTAICGTTGADVDVNVWGYLVRN